MERKHKLEGRERELLRSESNFMSYARYGLSLLSDLPRYYREADLAVQQKLIGSIYGGILVFDEGSYRTTTLNNAIALLGGKQAALVSKRKGSTATEISRSYLVRRVGLEPTTPRL